MAVTSKDNPGLTAFFAGLAHANPAPKRMRDVVGIDQRWRRRLDGTIIVIRNVHRAERSVEVSHEASVELLDHEAPSWPLDFEDLAFEFELLVSLDGVR